MVTSFRDGRSQNTWREPPTMGEQLISLITYGCESSASSFADSRRIGDIGRIGLLGNPTT